MVEVLRWGGPITIWVPFVTATQWGGTRAALKVSSLHQCSLFQLYLSHLWTSLLTAWVRCLVPNVGVSIYLQSCVRAPGIAVYFNIWDSKSNPERPGVRFFIPCPVRFWSCGSNRTNHVLIKPKARLPWKGFIRLLSICLMHTVMSLTELGKRGFHSLCWQLGRPEVTGP